jgi:hypothetical protein
MIFGLKAKLEKGIRWGDLKLVQSLVSSFPKTPQAAFFANKNKDHITMAARQHIENQTYESHQILREIVRCETKEACAWALQSASTIDEHHDVLRTLLDHISVDTVDRRGTTALMEAVRYGAISNVKLLLSFGADPLRRSADAVRAIDLEATKSRVRIERLLHSHIRGDSIDEPMSVVTREVLRAVRQISALGEANGCAVFSDFCVSDGALYLHTVDGPHSHRPTTFPDEWTFPCFVRLWDPETCDDYELIVLRLSQTVQRLHDSILPNCVYDFQTHSDLDDTEVFERSECPALTMRF